MPFDATVYVGTQADHTVCHVSSYIINGDGAVRLDSRWLLSGQARALAALLNAAADVAEKDAERAHQADQLLQTQKGS